MRPLRLSATTVALALAATGGTTGVAMANDDNAPCAVTSWQMTWGVKESFRAYLSGAIANGEWSTDGNVTYATPLFTIEGTEGNLAPDGSTGALETTASIRFFGHDGLLDQTLSSPRVEWENDEMVIVFDVNGDTQEGVAVDARDVSFVTVDISQASIDEQAGTWQVSGAPSVLTTGGADAFGTYPAGEAFDPIDLSVETAPGCLEDSGSSALVLGLAVGSLITVLVAIVAVRRWRGRERQSPGES